MLRSKFKLTLVAAVVLAIAGLSGCSNPNDAAETTAQLSGVVSKGIIVGGKVYAYPIINGVIVKTVPLGEATTNPKGKYTISISDYTGPVAIVVGPASDGSSQVKCDVPAGCSYKGGNYNFGTLMPFDYSLEALVPNVTGGSSISVSVTALTNMAAAYAKSLGLTANGDTVKLANEKVAKLLEVDNILGVEPVDVTDSASLSSSTTSPASIKYGYIAASIAAIANEDAGGNVGKAIASLSQSYIANNGELIGSEAVDAPEVISLLEITDGALSIMRAEKGASGGVFDLVKKEVEAKSESAKAATDTSTATNTETEIAVGDVESAKDIVTELRTWGAAARRDLVGEKNGMAEDAGALDRVDKALKSVADSEFEQVVVIMAESAVIMAQAYMARQKGDIEDGTYSIREFIGNAGFFAAGFFGGGEEGYADSGEYGDFGEYDGFGDYGAFDDEIRDMPISGDDIDSLPPPSGVVLSKADMEEIPQNRQLGGEVIVTGNVVEFSNVVIEDIDVRLKMTGPESASGKEFTFTLGQSSASNNNVEFVFNESFATISFVNDVENILVLDDQVDKPRKVVLDLSGKLAHKADSDAEVKMSFEGGIEAEVFWTYATWENGNEVEDINPGRLVFDGAFSIAEGDVNDAFSATLEVNMANAETFTQTAPKYFAGQTYPDFASYRFSPDGNKLIISWPDGDVVYTYDVSSKQVTQTRFGNEGFVTDVQVMSILDLRAGGMGFVSEFDSLDDFIANYPEFNEAEFWSRDIYLDNGYFFVENVKINESEWSKAGGTISATVGFGGNYGSGMVSDEDAENWRDLDGKLTMLAQLDELPEARVVASVDRYDYAAVTGSLTLSYDDVTIVVSGDINEEEKNNLIGSVSVIVKTAKGDLSIYPDVSTEELQGSVKVNGKVVGSISETDKGDLLVRYLDGTFETVLY